MDGVKQTPQGYLDASKERIGAAEVLFREQRFGECFYCAGLAVECLLRAFRSRRDPEFDERHDLPDLLRASGLEELVSENQQKRLSLALGQTWARWKNAYRYADTERLQADLRARNLFHGIRGDQLKANARTLLNNANIVLVLGWEKWIKA